MSNGGRRRGARDSVTGVTRGAVFRGLVGLLVAGLALAPDVAGRGALLGRSGLVARQEAPAAGPIHPDTTDAARVREAVERARDAQRDFERLRRRHYRRHPRGTERCDEHIGRFCLSHDGDDDWSPAPDPDEVVEARARLLTILDRVAASGVRDPWVTGQRVAYRLESGDAPGALDIVRPCPLEDARWCAALAGLVLHQMGDEPAAAAAFDLVRAALDPEARCRWDDISDLLSGDDAKAYGRTACGSEARLALERAFWNLSDPLWLAPGLERRGEHDARRVEEEIRREAASGYGLGWGRDLSELTVRYGWPAGWDLAWRRFPGSPAERSIEAHRSPGARRFAVEGVRDGAVPSWDLEDDAPRTTWAPPFGPVALAAEPQVAVLRRDGRRVIVVALVEPADSACVRERAVFLAEPGAIVARADGVGPALAVTEPEGRRAVVVGVEARCQDGTYPVRARLPLADAGEWLSDLLLLDPAPEVPGTLDATVARVRARPIVRSGAAVDVYWEWYGPRGALEVTLSLSRRGKSFWRKALEWTGLASPGAARAGVRWTDAVIDGPRARAVRLEVPELAPGTYDLTLQVQSARVGSVFSTRWIEVERGEDEPGGG